MCPIVWRAIIYLNVLINFAATEFASLFLRLRTNPTYIFIIRILYRIIFSLKNTSVVLPYHMLYRKQYVTGPRESQTTPIEYARDQR